MNTLIKWNIILSIFMIFSSCNFQNDKNEIAEYNERLFSFLKLDTIQNNNYKFIVLPPNECRICDDGVAITIDTVKNVVLYVPEKEFYYDTIKKVNKLIKYDMKMFKDMGLYKTYSVLYESDNHKIYKVIPLLK